MEVTKPVIALCSVGNLGKYVCDELITDGKFDFIVISRQSSKGDFFTKRNIDVRTSDYSADSVVKILDETNASALVSFNNSDGQTFITVHRAFLEACRRSKNCKRFIPSEFAGNIDDFPFHPSYFTESRVPFREVLRQEKDIEWTIFNNGWFMDYFLTEDKSYMPSLPNEFPIDPNSWKACIRGDGNEVQSFTSCRDVAKALIMLFNAPSWEHTTYITGQWSTFSEMADAMEKFYGRSLERTYRSEEDIHRDTLLPRTAQNLDKLYLASIEEMMITGSGSLPREKTLRQRSKFFPGMHFTSLEELLSQTKSTDAVNG